MAAKQTLPMAIEALGQVLNAIDKLESAEKAWVLQTAATRIGASSPGKPGNVVAPLRITGAGGGVANPREFIRDKAPKNEVQRVACLAFVSHHGRDAAHFKARDLSALNTEAAGPRFNLSRAVNNATQQNKYLAPAGSGRKQLTALGEDVVNALPDQAQVQVIELAARTKPKKAKKKSASKA